MMCFVILATCISMWACIYTYVMGTCIDQNNVAGPLEQESIDLLSYAII